MSEEIKQTYEIIESKGYPAIKCLVCDMVSYNENDIKQRYCGNCNQFHDIMTSIREHEKLLKQRNFGLQ